MSIAVSHGEGRVEFKTPENLTALQAQNLIVAQYIDSHLNVTETYPANPNGSALGITAISKRRWSYRSNDATPRACIPCREQLMVSRRLV